MLMTITQTNGRPAFLKLGARIREEREKAGLNQGELANLCGWPDGQMRISNYERGREPTLSDIHLIANALKTSMDYLLFGQHFYPEKDECLIPVFSCADIVSSLASVEANSKETKETVAMDRKFAKCYGLRVPNDSMISPKSGEISFQPNEIIIVDPSLDPKNNDFVIAHQSGADAAIFKQYIIDGANKYLKSLNPDYKKIEINKDIKIYGVVVAVTPNTETRIIKEGW